MNDVEVHPVAGFLVRFAFAAAVGAVVGLFVCLTLPTGTCWPWAAAGALSFGTLAGLMGDAFWRLLGQLWW